MYQFLKSPEIENDIISFCEGNLSKDSREIKRSIKIHQGYCGTYICAVAVSTTNDELNNLMNVPVDGTPLNKECYDSVRDFYVVEGVEWIEVGSIPVNYFLNFSIDFQIDIPLPKNVIKKYLTDDQRERFDSWCAKWNAKDFDIDLLQSVQTY